MSNRGIRRSSNGGILRRVRRIYIAADTFVTPSDHQEDWPIDVIIIPGSAQGAVRDNVCGLGAGVRVQITGLPTGTAAFGTLLSVSAAGTITGASPSAIRIARSLSNPLHGPFGLPYGTPNGYSYNGSSSAAPGCVIVDYLTMAPAPGGRYGVEDYANGRSGI